MILQFTPPKNATVFDIVLNTYGTLNMLSKFVSDNNISDLNILATGREIYNYDYDFVENYSDFLTLRITETKFVTGDETLRVFFEQINILTETPEILLNEDGDDFIIE